MEDIIEKKLLTFNQKKSFCMVIGHGKARKRLLDQLEEKPLLLGGKQMHTVANLKYLGDTVAGTLAESVHLTVKKRISAATNAVFEIKAIVGYWPLVLLVKLLKLCNFNF